MKKTYANQDWLMTIEKENKTIKFIFAELPRTPEVGNDDFTVTLTETTMDRCGSGDGYGVFREMLYRMEKLKMIRPIPGGWNIKNQEEVATLIFYFFENDEKVNDLLKVRELIKKKRCTMLKTISAIIGGLLAAIAVMSIICTIL